MSDSLRILLGLAVMIAGFLMVWKTEAIFSWTGQIDFAESKLGVGGTRLFLKIVGTGVVFLGIFIATNIISDILTAFAGVFTRGI